MGPMEPAGSPGGMAWPEAPLAALSEARLAALLEALLTAPPAGLLEVLLRAPVPGWSSSGGAGGGRVRILGRRARLAGRPRLAGLTGPADLQELAGPVFPERPVREVHRLGDRLAQVGQGRGPGHPDEPPHQREK